MLPSFLKKSLGILPQEYVCVALEDMKDHPRVFMSVKGSEAAVDITSGHIFLGYKPLIIAIRTDDNEKVLNDEHEVCLTFTQEEFKADTKWRGFITSSKSIARLQLAETSNHSGLSDVAFFTGKYGEQSFLRVHQAVAHRLADAIHRKPASDANIDGNLYEQVRIAYSLPRPISVITVKDNDLLNFFPTDLHGSPGSEHYLSSLRIGGMACDQVERVRRLVISKVDVTSFKKTYGLGKNHMSHMQPSAHFEPSAVQSASGIPVYPYATTYRELEMLRHWDIGIHRIFLYQVLSKGEVRSGKTLAHIHRYYAQWRINHGLSADYFFR